MSLACLEDIDHWQPHSENHETPKKTLQKPASNDSQDTPWYGANMLQIRLRNTVDRSGMPVPHEAERPVAYADRVGEWYVSQRSDRHRKDHGLFLTPVPAANFMASCTRVGGRKIRLLDPAAGAGVLCCAAVERLVLQNPKPDRIEVVAYEVDQDLTSPLRCVLDWLANWCRRSYGVEVAIRVEATDFVMANAEALQHANDLVPPRVGEQDFDFVISNPPYFKISKADPRAAAASCVVHGQPNIYALFMAVGAALLRPGGDFVFITPRSFASGPYFRQFRTVFFDMIQPVSVHVFDSRRNAFSRDEVLQENVILRGVRRDSWHRRRANAPLVVSSSRGIRDLGEGRSREVATKTALDCDSIDRVLRLPISDEDAAALSLVDSWPSSLHKLGLSISTGPVVPFRAMRWIGNEGDVPSSHVPLLWMSHVRPMRTTWPIDTHKPEYILRSGTEALVVPNKNYVLIRRFSAKEEARRLTAAPYLATDFVVPEVGLENHLNYIHRPGGTLSEDETWGLAALYNSRLLDTYFRAVNGNTQVSATELRAMPLPARQTIIALGQRVKHLANPMEGLDVLAMNLVTTIGLKEVAIG